MIFVVLVIFTTIGSVFFHRASQPVVSDWYTKRAEKITIVFYMILVSTCFSLISILLPYANNPVFLPFIILALLSCIIHCFLTIEIFIANLKIGFSPKKGYCEYKTVKQRLFAICIILMTLLIGICCLIYTLYPLYKYLS